MRLKPGVILLLGLVAAPAGALESDRSQPIQIQADRVLVDEARKISTYEGNVELTQGSLRVEADRIEVHRGKTGVDSLIATGEPVSVRQRPDDAEEDIRAEANRVEYTADKSLLELIGNARLSQGRDEFSGPRISYEADKNRVQAGDGRVHAVIHPQSEKTP